VRPVEGYPAGQGDWVRLGKQLGAGKRYLVGYSGRVRSGRQKSGQEKIR
jgi:hypothetical protein